MKCSYCGYEYGDDELKCPFCGAENTEEARERQHALLRELDKENGQIRSLFGQLLTEQGKRTLRIGKIILLAIPVFFLIVLVVSLIRPLLADQLMQSRLGKLEVWLQNGEYEKITDYVDEHGLYSYEYNKYWDVAQCYQYLNYVAEDLEWYDSTEPSDAKSQTSCLSFIISDCINGLETAEAALEDELYMGNETALEDIRSQLHNMLSHTLLLTDEEIKAIRNISHEHDTYGSELYLDYARLARERMAAAQF